MPAQNPYRIGLSVETSERRVNDLGASSVTERRCVVPVSKVESHILDRCSQFSSVPSYPVLASSVIIDLKNKKAVS